MAVTIVPDQGPQWDHHPMSNLGGQEAIENPHPQRLENAAVTALREGRKRLLREIDDYKLTLRRAQADAENAKTAIRLSEHEIAQIDCALAVLDARVS